MGDVGLEEIGEALREGLVPRDVMRELHISVLELRVRRLEAEAENLRGQVARAWECARNPQLFEQQNDPKGT